MWQGWLNIVLGVWISLTPFIYLDFPWSKLNNIFAGIIAAFVSGSIPIQKGWVSWLGIGAGTWVALSTYFNVFLTGEAYRWSNTISGVLIFVAGSLALTSLPNESNAI